MFPQMIFWQVESFFNSTTITTTFQTTLMLLNQFNNTQSSFSFLGIRPTTNDSKHPLSRLQEEGAIHWWQEEWHKNI